MNDTRKKNEKTMETNEEITEFEEPIKRIPTEDIESHPELSRIIEEPTKPKRYRRQRFIPKQNIERLNKPLYTNLILGLSLVLSLGYFTFGVLGAITNFGITESGSWRIFEATAILGWEQMRITGFILIIIGVIMFWSVPYYLTAKTQKADSYLVIGAGIGIIFGVIYILVILADVITAIITTISDNVAFKIETFFYVPIILAIFAIPLFRVLSIRHMVVLPSMDEEDKLIPTLEKGEFAKGIPKEEKKWRFEHHHYQRQRENRQYRRDWKDQRKGHRRRKYGRKK
ncbi:MAG: hypothetical protein KAS22_12340 [Candidatus Heimdallarchaeota archaeon]|nr:hypothetical protein [Candidatus Heimdallarchaeota archaeon]